MSTCWRSRIVGVARPLFESGDYFVQHFRRCGDYSRAASDRANTVILTARLPGIYGDVNCPCPRAIPSDSGQFTAWPCAITITYTGKGT